jgi:hypothetical protein
MAAKRQWSDLSGRTRGLLIAWDGPRPRSRDLDRYRRIQASRPTVASGIVGCTEDRQPGFRGWSRARPVAIIGVGRS